MDSILKETPEHLLNIISDILRAFLLRMRFSETETEELVGKVKEKKMGILFENVVPFDIEKERREKEEAVREAEERSIQLCIEIYQEMSASKEMALQQIMKKFALDEKSASAKMDLYWKK